MAKKIQFDPELMQHIKTIYGDAGLNGKVLKQLHQVWENNPDFIRNTAKQKLVEQKVNSTPFSNAKLVEEHKGPMKLQSRNIEIANDDLSGVQSFKTDFREGKNRGLKFFQWKKTKENPSGLFNTVTRDEINSKYPNFETPISFTISSEDWANLLSKNVKKLESNPVKHQSTDFEPDEEVIITSKKQQGGTMNQQQGIEQQVIQLVQAASQGDQQATQQIEQILQAAQQGNQQAIQIAQIIQKVVEAMKQQSGIKARLGAKLSYINKLKGICPEGTEKVYMAKGGCMCKKVAKNQNGGDTEYTESQKNYIKKYNKAMKNAKDEAARDSIAINDFGDSSLHEEVGHKGKFNPNKENKVGGATWEPDRSKYKTEKKACGSKLKKRK